MASGSGNATHLGRFAVTYEVEVNLLNRASIGSAQFIAAKGDSIFAEFIGQGNPIEGSDFSFIVETNTITGGTGRFAGTTRSFTVERLLNRVTASPPVRSPGPSCWTTQISLCIDYPGRQRRAATLFLKGFPRPEPRYLGRDGDLEIIPTVSDMPRSRARLARLFRRQE
jgi:hypothetical protein